MNEDYILKEMEECRAYCSLILRARQNTGFISRKYPITDVKVNRYFFDNNYLDILADECNISGYMDISPIEYIMDFQHKDYLDYHREEKDGRIVYISTTKSDWQKELFDIRSKKREEAEKRKELNVC